MKFAPLFFTVVALAYLIGSVPFGLLIARLKGMDIRQHGSGNIGATNVWRVLGRNWGLPVFILDVVKGLVSVMLGKFLAGHWGAEVALPHGHMRTDFLDPSIAGIAAAMAAILGHNFPVWLKFKGGKGVATSIGVLFGLMPVAAALTFATWGITLKLTRYVSVASIMGALGLPLFVLGLYLVPLPLGMVGWPYFYFTLAASLSLILRHRGNIQRLMAGTEPRMGDPKEPAPKAETPSPATQASAHRSASESSSSMYDVIIVGGGPAGLSAALVLGRCRRRVLLFNAGAPRNAMAREMHGFISRDGTPPAEFLRLSREQLAKYECVELREGRVVAAERGHEQFTVKLEDGSAHVARILLLASGLADDVPKIEGIERFYGKSVHLCPYCDGWEHKDEKIAVYGQGQMGADLALEMLGWSPRITLLTDGDEVQLHNECDRKLTFYEIPTVRKKIARVEGEGDCIRGVRFTDGEFLPCDALFFASSQQQRSPLIEQLGCEICHDDDVSVKHVETKACGIPGLYVAGNTGKGLQLVIMAAASGTQAAFHINQALLDADQDKRQEVISE